MKERWNREIEEMRNEDKKTQMYREPPQIERAYERTDRQINGLLRKTP